MVSSRPKTDCKEAESTMVWKHVVQHSMRTDDLVNADIIQDPTLPRTNGVSCPEVSHTVLTSRRAVLLHCRRALQGCWTDLFACTDLPGMESDNSILLSSQMQCGAKDAVYLQASSGAQQGISLFFVCCQCNNM